MRRPAIDDDGCGVNGRRRRSRSRRSHPYHGRWSHRNPWWRHPGHHHLLRRRRIRRRRSNRPSSAPSRPPIPFPLSMCMYKYIDTNTCICCTYMWRKCAGRQNEIYGSKKNFSGGHLSYTFVSRWLFNFNLIA